MNEPTIMRHEVLEQIDTGDPFDLVFLTADRHRGTGGERREVKGWVKIKTSNPEQQPLTNKESGVQKNPEHRKHKTFNICNPKDPRQHPVKIHWRLMYYFNGKRILQ